MSKLNLLVDLKFYEGNNANSFTKETLKAGMAWQGFDISEQYSREIVVPANGLRTILAAEDTFFSVPNLVMPVPKKEKIVIQTEQDRSYIFLEKKAIPDTIILSIGRVLAHIGDDFIVEILETGTKITWQNSLIIGAEEQMEIGDIVNVFYNYTDSASASELSSDVFFPLDYDNLDTSNFYRMLYLECMNKCKLVVNGVVQTDIDPVTINGIKKPGVFLKSSIINDVHIVNPNNQDITIYIMMVK